MDIASIKVALKAWAVAQTGLPACWENEPRPTMPKKPGFVILTWPHSIRAIGQDYAKLADDTTPGSLTATVVGNREILVGVKVQSRSQVGNSVASFFTEKLRTSLAKPSVLAAFREAGLASSTIGDTAGFDHEIDGVIESIAAFDLRLNAIVAESDTPLGTLESVGLSSVVSGVGGAVLPTPPNVVDELIE